ncbi:MAG: hypothetical protein DWP94_02700 [Flavobacterium sp.]|nr:MAG: hypothetical protein DWP94_02700 [Flavobacterium sp.]
MKKIYTILLALNFTMWGFAQEDCSYKINVDTEEENFKLTSEQLMEYELSRTQSVFIYFSLMREGDLASLVMQISLNALEMPPIMCFDKRSRITFLLEDGSYVSLPYLDEVNCGRQTDHEDQLDNSTSEAAFFINREGITKLKKSELKSMRITSMNTNFDIEFKHVLSNAAIEVPIYPREYFIKNLGCIE